MEFLGYLAAGWAVVWTVLAVVLMTTLISYERGFVAFIVLALTIALLEFFSDWSLVAWAAESPGRALGMAVIYIAAGVFWSMIKWKLYLDSKVARWREAYRSANSALRPGQANQEFREWLESRTTELSVERNSERILTWMAWWPFSLLETLFSDFLGRLWRGLFSSLRDTYEGILRRALR